jgi:hypothetical protein
MTGRVLQSVAAFAVCFAVGASLSLFAGLDHWVPAGMATSSFVALMAWRTKDAG